LSNDDDDWISDLTQDLRNTKRNAPGDPAIGRILLLRLAPARLRTAVLLAGTAFNGLLGLYGCGGEQQQAERQQAAVQVSVIKPAQRELPETIRVTGTLHGNEETTIAAKVPGRIVETLKDLGDYASTGEPLVRIDPTDYELSKREREFAFAETLARLGLLEIPPDTFDVEALPSVERARLQAENANLKYERGRKLVQEDPPVISEQDLIDLRTAWEVAQSNLKMERLTAQATLAEARTLAAQVAIAEQRVRDTTHRAPGNLQEGGSDAQTHEGASHSARRYEVAARMVTVGDFVQVGAPLFRLVNADPLKLRAPVNERRLGMVKADQTVIVHVEAFEQPFQGRVSRVSPAVEMATRAFEVEIIVPNAARTLKPGSFAIAEIEIGAGTALLIPKSAIITFAGVQKIMLVQDGKAKEQRVELGREADDLVEIRTGLSATDQIVAKPPASLTSGTPVQIAAPTGDSELTQAPSASDAPAPKQGQGASP
jgi:multidrug efflux pump subunit AcrA (membrane-fusion protein)